MQPQRSQPRNGLLAVRVSSTRQGIEGDSPEAQREQGERFASQQNVAITKVMTYLESASKENQPMQHVVDYAIDPKNGIDVVIVKSIDRFTRGGSTVYDQLKMQLEPHNIDLIDIYGVISNTKVNTLEHLGVEYKWSVFAPSRKTELLEAERAKDELRDIMSRMIGAEVRYTRLGYWMRRPPYGYTNIRTETLNGKRNILTSHPEEAEFIRKMFELRCRGNLNDRQIVEEINSLGYASRTYYRRSRDNSSELSVSLGGKKLTLKRFWKYIQSPVYAGVLCEKWTDFEPVKCPFEGLVSYETFNKANRGKLAISEQNGVIKLIKQESPAWQRSKGALNDQYPYRKVIMCPKCSNPLYGSAAKGKTKYYPGYHCNKRGHYFRVPKAELENKVMEFTRQIAFDNDHIEDLMSAVQTVWEKRKESLGEEEVSIERRVEILQEQAQATIDKIKVLRSESAIKYMEEDLMKIEDEIRTLEEQKTQKQTDETTDLPIVMQYAKYFLQHLDYLLLKQIDPIKKANFFSIIFDQTPTFAQIDSVTPDIGQITGINELFKLRNMDQSLMVRVKRL